MCFNIFLLCFSACVTLGLVHRVLPLWRNPAFVVKPGIYVPLCLCMIEVTWSCFPQRSSCRSSPLSQPMRCGQLSLLQCGKVCGALLNCAEHTCTQVCHSGQCQPCQLQVQQCECHMQWSSRLWVKHHHNSRLLLLCLVVCYCGVTVREALCGTDRGGFDGVGHFSCEKLCGK